jgi:hypothetical protein
MKKQPRYDVDDYGQYNASGGDVQLPRLVRSVDQRAVTEHLPPND